MCRLTRSLFIGALACSVTAGVAGTASARVHPGAMTFTKGAQCTSNFVFRDASDVYLGQAAHCAGTGVATDTDGCKAHSRPLGTRVRIEGARKRGRLVYSSWLTMQDRRGAGKNACAFNDFALIKLRRADARRVDPTVPAFGGPTGLGGSREAAGDPVYSYGNSSLRPGDGVLSPKQGIVVDRRGKGWSLLVETVTPGIPGDSGSGFLDAKGRAIGVLSTLDLAPEATTNGVGALRKELRYVRRNSALSSVRLVRGEKPFEPSVPELPTAP
jgi:hypothetical protein